MPDDAEREQWLRERVNGYSDEFSSAARAITDSDDEQKMVRENNDEEAADGQQGTAEDSHLSALRHNIAQFVGAFEGHTHARSYALHSVRGEAEKRVVTYEPEVEASAMVYICVCVCVSVNVYIHIFRCVCVYSYVRVFIYIYMYICIHIYIYMYVCM